MGRREVLGENVLPILYDIKFEPNLKNFRYKGSEVIELNIKKKTKEIKLNAKELSLKKVIVKDRNGEQNARVKLDAKKERVILSFNKYVDGNVALKISFEGTHNDKMYGFYRSSYEKNGRREYLLSTQFEAANARSAFPCFDEPKMKAKFKVSILVEKKYDCISNTPIKSSKRAGTKKLVIFEETPRMTPYLLYLGVGRFEYSESKLNRIKIRVITTPGKKAYTQIPLDYSKKFLSFFESYFGIKYPLKKMDLVAIPDFAAAGMENWGAITFREVALLVDNNSSVALKERVAEVIAHEFAHQWFGDLVTMEWWDDLWLNESFATFMSFKAMDKVFPEWSVKKEYLDDVIATALVADQLLSTHPISIPVYSPSDIDRIFDDISYEKGGSVINMMEDYVGEETFRSGLNYYLKKNSYFNATKSDLWRLIDYAAKKRRQKTDVYEVASAWITKKGYPIIDVVVSGNKAELSQRRFVLLHKDPGSSLWPIPITLIDSKGNEKKFLMKEKRILFTVNGDWIKLNYRQNGLYRVSYKPSMLNTLGKQIKDNVLDSVDGWGIENDLFIMARSARIGINEYLDFIENYCLNADYPLNSNLLSHLNWLFFMLYEKEGSNERVKRVMRKYSNMILGRLGWEWKSGERNVDTLLRSSAMASSGIAGDESTLERARKMLSESFEGKSEINMNIRGAIYKLATWTGNRELFDTFKKRYLEEEVPEEKVRLLGSLGGFKDHELISSALDYSLSKEVRLQDSIRLPAVISGNPMGKELVWRWTKKNWKSLMNKFPSGVHMLDRYISNLRSLSDRQLRGEIESFFKDKKNMRTDIKEPLKMALEVIEANALFVEKNSRLSS